MTDKELRRLNRAELLEILVSMKKELDSTAEENISPVSYTHLTLPTIA